jgi:hypothetical protein
MNEKSSSGGWEVIRSAMGRELAMFNEFMPALFESHSLLRRCPYCGHLADISVRWRRGGAYVEWDCEPRYCGRRGYAWWGRRPLISRIVRRLRREGITRDDLRRLGAIAAEVVFWLCYAVWMVSLLAKLRR